MLRNFITTSDLVRYDLAIGQFLPQGNSGGQTDWSPQIEEAFEQLKDRLRLKRVSSRLLGVPLDLNRPLNTSAPEHALIALTKNESYSGTHIQGLDGFRRFAVTVLSSSESSGFLFLLQGSNDILQSESAEPEHWVTVGTLVPDGTGEYSVVFQNECCYYRVVLTMTGEPQPVTFTAGIYETYQDRWIIWLSLALIYRMISKSADDVWLQKSRDALALFETSFEQYPFLYDANEDNIPDRDELQSTKIRLVR